MKQSKKIFTTMRFCRWMVCGSLIWIFAAFTTYAQREVTGTVTDDKGMPIPGANVVIKNTTVGTITDIYGKFSINVPDENPILVFSFVGYLNHEKDVTGMSDIVISLAEEITELDEIVVIGYGTQKRSDLTGAIASVSAEEMVKTNSGNVLTAMQGKAAGIQISPSTGTPGSETIMRIRGIGSISNINGDNKARQKEIWIVDGVPSDANSVNPADIESMEIIKDASAGAIYGSTAANGVILVTTKKGSTGKINANLNYYRGWNELPRKVDILNGSQFAQMINELNIIQNTRNGLVDRPNVLDVYGIDTMGNYDYQDLLFKTAITNNIDFSVSGGSEKLTSYLSLGYNSEEGILKNQEYNRFLGLIKVDYTANKYITIGSKIDFKLEERLGVPEWRFFDEYNSPITAALSFAPFQAPYKEGAHPDSIWNTNPISNVTNPFLTVDLADQTSKSNSANAILYAILSPVKGLVFETRFKSSLNNDHYLQIDRKYYYDAANKLDKNKVAKNYGTGYGFLTQNTLTYASNILEVINYSAMVGYEASRNYYTQLSLSANDMRAINEESLFFGGSNILPDADIIINEYATDIRGYSYFGRVNLDYKSMILLQGNYRRDASSLFGPKNRIGTFPGVSAGFKFTELDFFKQFNWLSFGKIRYGWGKSGNNPIPPYTYFARVSGGLNYANAQYSFDNNTSTTGFLPINLANTAIRWETVETSNIGLDLNFFRNKLSFTAERFRRSNIDMLYQPTMVGFAGWNITESFFENNNINSIPYANIGKISSRGWEFSLGYKDRDHKFRYDVSVNVSYIRNKADYLNDEVIYDGSASRPNGDLTRTIEGGDIGEYYGFKIIKMFEPEDCDTLTVNVATSINKPRWGKKVKATNQPIKEIVSSFIAVNARGDSVFKTISKIDTIYVQNNASAGDFQFWDANGDGVLNSEDYQPLGNPFAPYLFGLNVNLEYGWFDLNMMWQGNYGNKIFNARKAQMSNADGQTNWSVTYLNNYYRDAIYDYEGNLVLEGRAGTYPRLDPVNQNQNLASPSEFFIEDGSFLKLRSMQIGLTLPARYSRYIGVQSLRIYAGGRNLLTLTKYTGIDPEIELRNPLVAGIDKGGYPIPRTYNAGINVQF